MTIDDPIDPRPMPEHLCRQRALLQTPARASLSPVQAARRVQDAPGGSDVSERTVQEWRSGERAPSAARMQAFVTAFQITERELDWMLTGRGPSPLGDVRIAGDGQ